VGPFLAACSGMPGITVTPGIIGKTGEHRSSACT
jgi:hypothetical protein